MESIYEEFMNKLVSVKDPERATVVYLWGDLGSGKTTFTKNLCKYLGLGIDITSPTFTILKTYNFNVKGFESLVHIDAYRLNSYEDLLKIKFEEYLKNIKNIIFIEWPSVIENERIMPNMNVRFDHVEDSQSRSIKID